ncbi:hypothetical protein BC940DRAFT_237110 [Gongronella butleri]|nr:hypothetical protein BC940DRAFT_237110 [Gongronella butleri]
MSFDQLTMVRQDGIVDETVVFRALWQRESLDRLLYPAFDRQTQRSTSSSSSSPTMPASAIPIYNKKLAPPQPEDTTDRHNALNEYFDVDGATTEKEKRRRILLGTPRTRFCASVVLDCPFSSHTDSWQPVTLEPSHTHTSNAAIDASNDDSDTSSHTQTREITTPAWRKFVYSDSEHVLGHWYRVRVEATALHCRFDLQRDGPSSVAQRGDHEATSSSTSPSIMGASNPAPKIRYTIYCLKRHQATMPPEHIDPEDRVFVPVSQVTEMEQDDDVPTCSSTAASPATNGYVSTIKMEFDDLKTDQGQLNIDMMVALEVFGLQQEPGV